MNEGGFTDILERVTAPGSWITSHLDEPQFRRLVEFVGKLSLEAHHCARAHCYQAACIMEVSALELALAGQVCILEPELRDRGGWPRVRAGFESPLTWSLKSLLRTATSGGWFSDPRLRLDLGTSKFADLLTAVRDVRNLAAHPVALIRARVDPASIGRREYETVKQVADLVFALLDDALQAARG